MSILYCLYFLLYPGKANEMVFNAHNCKHSRYRRHFTIDIIRNSWGKGTHPLLAFLNKLHTPKIKLKKDLNIPSLNGLPTSAILYFDGSEEELKRSTSLIFLIPGGGFVTLAPQNYDDVISIIAKKTQLPILAINYRKAPEFPFPEALEECFEVYHKIVKTNGKLIGIYSESKLNIKICGDSAGGNLSCGVILKAMENQVELPSACCLLCPLLTFEVQGWMSQENQSILSKAVPQYYPTKPAQGFLINKELENLHLSKIEVSSRFKYFNDMILTPEYLLGLALMYLRKYPKAEPDKDHFLSPIGASKELLSKFPPTFIQIGDKDPLVDDSLLFYSKLKEFGCNVEVELLKGISHGYLQMLGLLKESHEAVNSLCKFLQ